MKQSFLKINSAQESGQLTLKIAKRLEQKKIAFNSVQTSEQSERRDREQEQNREESIDILQYVQIDNVLGR